MKVKKVKIFLDKIVKLRIYIVDSFFISGDNSAIFLNSSSEIFNNAKGRDKIAGNMVKLYNLKLNFCIK